MRRFCIHAVGSLLLGFIPLAQSQTPAPLAASIRWTALGIPHIQATSERGLGYGIGYAYARDNLCLLAEEIVTVRGERARYFGASGQSSAQIDNIPSDIFFRWLNDEARLQAIWQAQPEAVQQRLEGYAAGFNRYLRDLPSTRQPADCAGRPWLRSISHWDLLRLMQRLLVESGLGRFVEAVVGAAPPDLEQAAGPLWQPPASSEGFVQRLAQFGDLHGSNAVAVGAQLSDNGKGLVLGNPHFPWSGGLRFYQMHLTIPGHLDVMGAALPGLPLVNIGFNAHLAWTHTVDNSRHFTVHRLSLNPENPDQYWLDGRWQNLEKRLIPIEVLGEEGQLVQLEHYLYLSKFGPLLNLPDLLEWTEATAYALQDANLDNWRALPQWMAINRASSLKELRRSVETLQGIPWVNTVAADDQGNTLYLNLSVVPNLTPEQQELCLNKALLAQRLPVLDASNSHCQWTVAAGTAQPGIVPAAQQPQLERRDFVQNSNDSAWLTNPAVPLTGFPWLVSRETEPLKARTRFALSQIPHWKPGSVGMRQLEQLVTENRVYMADLLMPDLLILCQDAQAPATLCQSFRHWNRQAGVNDGLGPLYFRYFMNAFQNISNPWRVPFDPQSPLTTPRGLALDNAVIREQLLQALQSASEEAADAGQDQAGHWGAIQVSTRGEESIPIPGGPSHLGVYNAIESLPGPEGRLEVISGSSYLQLVRFDKDGPQARGLLSFSQSTDPTSVHFKDQTWLFSRQQWQVLPFSETQIQAASPSAVLHLSE